MIARCQIMKFSAKIIQTTNFKMTFQTTKNSSNHNKAINYVIIIRKAQYESLIEIAEHFARRILKNVWAGKLKIFWLFMPGYTIAK